VTSGCDGVFSGIAMVCSDDDDKAAIKASVKKVVCKHDPKATKDKMKRYGPAMTLKKGVLTAGYTNGTANIYSSVREWLMNNL
jgi:pyridoxal biosynthesis lyase PdxS